MTSRSSRGSMEGGDEPVECGVDIFVSFFELLGLGVWEGGKADCVQGRGWG